MGEIKHITNEQRRIFVEGLLNGTLTIDDIANLTGSNRDTIRKSWTEQIVGGKAVAMMKLQNQMDDGIATRKLMRERTRRFTDFDHLRKLLEENGRERYERITRDELWECECYSESVIAILSDLHIGQEYCNAIGEYNLNIAKERLDEFANQIILNTDDCDTVHLFLLGDLIENLHLHKSTALETRMDTIEQVKNAIELLSDFIYRLYENNLLVKIYSVSGNHDRLAPKDEVLRTERFADLITWAIERELSHLDGIEFTHNDEPTIITTKIEGFNIVGVHGDFDKNIGRLKAYCKNPDIVLIGHQHKFELSQNDGTMVVRNGALCGSGGNYCIEKRLSGRAEQTILKIRKDTGITNIIPVWLD